MTENIYKRSENKKKTSRLFHSLESIRNLIRLLHFLRNWRDIVITDVSQFKISPFWFESRISTCSQNRNDICRRQSQVFYIHFSHSKIKRVCLIQIRTSAIHISSSQPPSGFSVDCRQNPTTDLVHSCNIQTVLAE